MECPKCKSKNIFKTTCKAPIYSGSGKIIGYKPQYTCVDCYNKWDIVSK
jgi:hypothetical protein